MFYQSYEYQIHKHYHKQEVNFRQEYKSGMTALFSYNYHFIII